MRLVEATAFAVLSISVCAGIALGQAAPAAPTFETRKVADNVYAFRYGGYQSLFVVGKDGVIVTDPSARNKPDAVPTFIAEIRKITPLPVRYVIYTHSGYDHIAGGKPFKDMGATFIAHANAKLQIERMNNAPDVVRPDRTVGDGVTHLTLSGEKIDLVYPGPTRSDNMISVYLPKEKVLYAADWIGVGSAPCMNTSCSPAIWNYDHAVKTVMDLDWNIFVPGHAGVGGRWGAKDDLQRVRDYLVDLYAYTGQLAAQNKCNAESWKAAVPPEKYKDYVQPQVYQDQVERYCLAWNQGA
jgi:glyoxylase-like metal-dependent hydrolase (beta-lactamase superfamily II)